MQTSPANASTISVDRRSQALREARPWSAWRIDVSGLAGLLGVALLFAIWYAGAYIASPDVVPYPHTVFERVGEWFIAAPELSAYGLAESGLAANLIYTIENVLIAATLGTCIGTVIGVASGRYSLFRTILDPIVSGATSVPFLVMAPFFLVWFGVGRVSGLLLVTLYSTVVLIIFSQRAVLNLNPVYESNAATLGARHSALLFDILIPATIPEVLGGLRIALAGAWGLESVAELLGSNIGVGVMIRVILGQADTVGIMACVVAISTAAVLFDGLVFLVAKRTLRWRTP
jgi:ABC-type nitrate/sulfonate/bicarbonate transport system permease component